MTLGPDARVVRARVGYVCHMTLTPAAPPARVTAPPSPQPPPVADDQAARARALADLLGTLGPVLVGFSGGVDSTYLAAAARDALGPARTLAVLGSSPSVPAAQLEAARALAATLGVPFAEVDTREFDDPRYRANPTTRCYYCKTELWTRLAPLARARGMTLVDGTNADDLADHRPGARAAAEHGVRSPLAESGLTKADIRALSAARGLSTWQQPSAPCLASRLPYGTAVTTERLAQVERAEVALRQTGVTGDLRVRHHGDLARVEIPPELLDTWLAPGAREALVAAVRGAGFARVAVDLRGFRSGSLNVLGGVRDA